MTASEGTRVAVPRLTGLVIAFGVALTVVFGVWPGPLVDAGASTRRCSSRREAPRHRGRASVTTSISIPTPNYYSDALSDVGIEGSMCVWDDRSIDWADFELTVIRSTWELHARPGRVSGLGLRDRASAQPVSDH